jgi:integral membrane protein (TIGR00529 family)
MPDLVKVSVVFALILVLLRKKLNIGIVMSIAAFTLFLLYQMSPSSIFQTFRGAVLNDVTLKLVFALSFIRMFELILREHNVLTEMMGAVKALLKNRKLVTISMPLLIGMIPSVGGAYFSAPMVAEATGDISMSPEEKGFVNYWFRHPWEYILPLYPGILLAAAISGVELHNLITANLSYAILVLITGFIFGMNSLKGSASSEKRLSKKGLWSFAPIFMVVVFVLFFHIELQYALIALVVFLFLFYRYDVKSVYAAFRHGFALDVIILILGVMFFKEAMESSGAVKNLSTFFIEQGIPASPVLFLLPFVTGLITGITLGFVGSTFPLIIHIAGSASIAAISFAFAAGFLGVLLSPVHVCLVLTREYFKADLWGMYKMMLPACIIIFAAAVIQYMLLS